MRLLYINHKYVKDTNYALKFIIFVMYFVCDQYNNANAILIFFINFKNLRLLKKNYHLNKQCHLGNPPHRWRHLDNPPCGWMTPMGFEP